MQDNLLLFSIPLWLTLVKHIKQREKCIALFPLLDVRFNLFGFAEVGFFDLLVFV